MSVLKLATQERSALVIYLFRETNGTDDSRGHGQTSSCQKCWRQLEESALSFLMKPLDLTSLVALQKDGPPVHMACCEDLLRTIHTWYACVIGNIEQIPKFNTFCT